MTRAILSLSGGLDSTTVLSWLLHNDYEVIPVQFQYGSKHNAYEEKAAKKILDFYADRKQLLPLREIDLTIAMSGFKSNLLKSGGAIPEGHYEDSNMSMTVVPARNMIFLSVLAGLAESLEANAVVLGIHQGDHEIYPDCRKDFFRSMAKSIFLGTGEKVDTIAPFLGTDKAGIVEYGLSHGTPYSLTRTCYKDQVLSCGRCGSCVERLQAFDKNKALDPIIYEDREFWKSQCAK